MLLVGFLRCLSVIYWVAISQAVFLKVGFQDWIEYQSFHDYKPLIYDWDRLIHYVFRYLLYTWDMICTFHFCIFLAPELLKSFQFYPRTVQFANHSNIFAEWRHQTWSAIRFWKFSNNQTISKTHSNIAC